MKWVDYREKLGICFDDDEKFRMLSNMLQNYVENRLGEGYDEVSHLNYCQMVGEAYYDHCRPYQFLLQSLERCRSTAELISKFIAVHNIYKPAFNGYHTVSVFCEARSLRTSSMGISLRQMLMPTRKLQPDSKPKHP